MSPPSSESPMRVLAAVILSMSLLAWTKAWADPTDGMFDSGVWHGSAVSTESGFASCDMQALFGRKDAPVALTIGLDRLHGWTLAVRSDRLVEHTGQIEAGLAFDDEAPIDLRGEVVRPTMVSFRFPSTKLLDRHDGARKLVLILDAAALPFSLSGFQKALEALRGCLAANTVSAPDLAAETDAGAAPPAAGPPVEVRTAAPDPGVLPQIVAPMIMGFLGSVLLVLVSGGVLFQVLRARARSRYLKLWSAEYRCSVTRPLSVGLLDPRAAA